jgi:hypothetical protein
VLATYYRYITSFQECSYRRKGGRGLNGRKMDDVTNIIKKYDFLHLTNVKLINQIKKINSMTYFFKLIISARVSHCDLRQKPTYIPAYCHNNRTICWWFSVQSLFNHLQTKKLPE